MSGIQRPHEMPRVTGGQRGGDDVDMNYRDSLFSSETDSRTSQVSGKGKSVAEEQEGYEEVTIAVDV